MLGGTRPTVTDASLVLGYIDPAFFLGGTMMLDVKYATAAIEKDVAQPLGLDLLEAASAILTLATENMVSAIEEITIHQGIDPRSAVVVGGGGAAGLNAVAIARRLGCTTVIIPEVVPALSAAGALISDLHADYRSLFYTSSDHFDFDGVNASLDALAGKCQAFLEGPGSDALEKSIAFFAEARYHAQIWEIDLPLHTARFKTPEDVSRVRMDFDRLHEEIFAYNDPMAPLVHPPPGDPYHEQWNSMSRFQRLCWLWQADNAFIRTSLDHTVRFELLLSDYDYFKSELLDYVGLEVDPGIEEGLEEFYFCQFPFKLVGEDLCCSLLPSAVP